MPLNISVPLFKSGEKDQTYRVTADVVGKTFAAVSGDIQSGPVITTVVLPSTFDGGNEQAATCAAGAKAVGVFAYNQASGGVVPVIGKGATTNVTSGAAITAGVELEVGTGGKAITLASGRPVGIAKSTVGGANLDVYVELY